MLRRVVESAVRQNQIALGAVLVFGLAGPAFAGTSLSCAGYPRNVSVFTGGGISTFVQVCKITALKAPLTASLSVTASVGNVLAHGAQTEAAIPVYARIVAQDATAAKATALANSVIVSTKNAAVSAQEPTVNYPRSLEVDYEVFTPSTTEMSLTTAAGNVSANNYTVVLNATANTGNVALQTIDGDVHAKTATGTITVGLSSTAWTGAGLTATTGAGNILLSRPEGYQARITATADIGEVEVDGKTKAFPFPASITTSSGQPITLTSHVGNVTVVPTN